MVPALQNQAMPELTAMQLAFVTELVTNRGNIVDAAIKAGFAERSAREQAYKLIRKDKVMQAYQMMLASELAAAASGAVGSISDLSTGAKSEYVKLQAAQDLLDRIGMRAPDKVDHRVSGEVRVSIDLG